MKNYALKGKMLSEKIDFIINQQLGGASIHQACCI